MARISNGYERVGRIRKVNALRKVVARMVGELHLNHATSNDIADAFDKFTLGDWARIAVVNGIKPPSAETVRELLYSIRATQVIDVEGVEVVS